MMEYIGELIYGHELYQLENGDYLMIDPDFNDVVTSFTYTGIVIWSDPLLKDSARVKADASQAREIINAKKEEE